MKKENLLYSGFISLMLVFMGWGCLNDEPLADDDDSGGDADGDGDSDGDGDGDGDSDGDGDGDDDGDKCDTTWENPIEKLMANKCYPCHQSQYTSYEALKKVGWISSGDGCDTLRFSNGTGDSRPEHLLNDEDLELVERWHGLGHPETEEDCARMGHSGCGHNHPPQ